MSPVHCAPRGSAWFHDLRSRCQIQRPTPRLTSSPCAQGLCSSIPTTLPRSLLSRLLVQSTLGTSEALVKKMAALEGGSAAVAVSYGHAAQLLAFSNILQPGDHFIATDKIHGGTYTQLGRQFNSLVGRSRSAASKTLRVDTAVPTRFATKLPLRVWFVLCVMFSRLVRTCSSVWWLCRLLDLLVRFNEGAVRLSSECLAV